MRSFGQLHAPRYDIDKTIVISSSGRGGSTWLAELLWTMPGYVLQWEPTHLHTAPSCKAYGFDWNPYLPVGARDPKKREYLEGLFTGRGLNIECFSSSHFAPRRFLDFKGYLVKLTAANMLYPWMLRELPVRALLLIRHPCAVVASQMAHSGWGRLTKSALTFPPELARDFPHFARVFRRIETLEELLAFEWATQVYVPLAAPQPHPWLLVAYEDLVLRRNAELERIFGHLGEPMPCAAVAQLDLASGTTQHDSNVALGRNPLTTWKRRLSAEQIARIYSVVHEMGIHFYDGEEGPTLEASALRAA